MKLQLLPRFSLRLVFISLTLFAVLLGWLARERNIAQNRNELIGLLQESLGKADSDNDFDQNGFNREFKVRVGGFSRVVTISARPTYFVSFIRRQFGDRGFRFLLLPPSLESRKLIYVEAFPEALVLTESEFSEVPAGNH